MNSFCEIDSMDHILISILMPVYNGAPYIKNALDSVLAQSAKGIDIFISDNGSTDETHSIIVAYMAKDHRIRSVRHTKMMSVGDNFCFCLENCIGKYYLLLAHDDKLTPGFIEKAIDILEKHGEIIGVFSKVRTENYITGEVTYFTPPNLVGCNVANLFSNYLKHISPSFVYGIFRSDYIFLHKEIFQRYYDWGDCVFVYNALKYGEIFVFDKVFYTAGICDIVRHHITTRKDNRLKFEYFPFLFNGSSSILSNKKMSFLSKIRILLLHINVVTALFLGNEKVDKIYTLFIRIINKITSFLNRVLN